MFTKDFETEVEAIAEITAGKVESCATALRTRFEEAIDNGITDLNLAAEKAVVLHAHLDHGAGLDVPENFPFTLDAEVETHLTNEMMADNADGRAEERIDLTLDLYRKYRKWGVNVFFSGTAAYRQAQIQWEKMNPAPDLDEGDFFKMLETDLLPNSLRKLIHAIYDDERMAGKNVRDSAISAVGAARMAAQLSALLGKDADAPDLSGLIGGISST